MSVTTLVAQNLFAFSFHHLSLPSLSANPSLVFTLTGQKRDRFACTDPDPDPSSIPPSTSPILIWVAWFLCFVFVYVNSECPDMIPSYHFSPSSSIPLDLNEDLNNLISPNHQPSSSSSSLPYLFNPDQAAGSYYWEEAKPSQGEEAEKTVPSSGSWDYPDVETGKRTGALKLKLWNKEDGNENDKADEDDGSLKWLPSKMRIIRKTMMGSDHRASDLSANSMHKFEDQTQPLSSPATDDNSSNSTSINRNITIRVCADCHTTKTPLWRSGPSGPKSLCNACGIRQRKARRAMAAAAASENGTILAAETPSAKGNSKLRKHNKENKSKIGRPPEMKRKRKLQATTNQISRGRKKFSFEDFAINLSKNLALQQLVFPQDEKEAAILLMSLSYGLVHG